MHAAVMKYKNKMKPKKVGRTGRYYYVTYTAVVIRRNKLYWKRVISIRITPVPAAWAASRSTTYRLVTGRGGGCADSTGLDGFRTDWAISSRPGSTLSDVFRTYGKFLNSASPNRQRKIWLAPLSNMRNQIIII